MAYVTDTHIVAPVQSVFSKAAKAIGAFFIKLAEANGRARIVAVLNNKTDRELADIGIAREDIVRHVFHDKMYI